jgi:hypothetical protein
MLAVLGVAACSLTVKRERVVERLAADVGLKAEHRGHGHHLGVGRDRPGDRAGSPMASPVAIPARAAKKHTIRGWPARAAVQMFVMALGGRPAPRGSGGCGSVI